MFRSRRGNQGKRAEGANADQGEQPQISKRLPKANPVSQSLAMRSIAAQTKPRVSQPGDPHEREADHIADRVMRSQDLSSPPHSLPLSDFDSSQPQRQRAGRDDEKLSRKEQDNSANLAATVPPALNQTLNSPGEPLDNETRHFMEPRLGQDLSGVRVHSGGSASESARALNARALTVGSDIVFGAGEYEPGTSSGDHLIAHELTHVVQQSSARQAPVISRQAGGAAPAVTPADEAKQAIADFRARTSPQAFPGLDRATVAAELERRVASPEIIAQAGLAVCGPAAAVYVFASKDIVSYVKLGINLFENGEGNFGTLKVKPSKDLKSKSPASYTWKEGLTPGQADWMILSSVRDSENTVIDFEGGPTETTSGSASVDEVAAWLRKLGFSKVTNSTSPILGDTTEDAVKVNPSVSPGNYIVLFVNAHLIDPKAEKSRGGNHFVVLLSPFTVTQDTVTFRVWSWGRFIDVSASVKDFNAMYYGPIIATK